MKARFFLADKNTTKTSIVLTIREGNSRIKMQTLRIGTGIVIEPKAWDTKEERVRRNYTSAATTNRTLSEIATKVDDLYNYAKKTLKVEPLPYIKEELPKAGVLSRPVAAPKQNQSVSVLDAFQEFIEQRRSTDAKASVKIYTTTYNHLCTFIGKKRKVFTFDTITSRFHDRYVNYLLETAQLTNNTVGKHLMIFKTFLHWTEARGYHKNSEYKNLFKRTEYQEDTTTIALTSDELTAIESLDLIDNIRLGQVRDLFLISCYTAMRFSDVSTLKAHSIQDGMIRIFVTKTKSTVSIPVTEPLQAVLDRYPDFVFPTISNQKANEYLKEIGQLAGVTSIVEVVRFRGGEKLSQLLPKWQVLSTHTARRTFITISLQRGMQAESVRRISGHKDMRSFQKYVKYADEYLKKEMKKAWILKNKGQQVAKFRYEVEILLHLSDQEWEIIFKQAEFDRELGSYLRSGEFLEGIKNRIENNKISGSSDPAEIYLNSWKLDKIIKSFELPVPGIGKIAKDVYQKLRRALREVTAESNILDMEQD